MVSQKVVTPLKSGVQEFYKCLKTLDAPVSSTGQAYLVRHDANRTFSTFRGFINIEQGISNFEVKTLLFCGFLFDIQV